MKRSRCSKRLLLPVALLALMMLCLPAWADRYILLGEPGLQSQGLSAKSALEGAGHEVLESFPHVDGALAELSDAEVSALTADGTVKAIPADLPLYPATELGDNNGHGTWVTGVIAGDHTGVCPYVTVIPFKIADSSGDSYSEWLVRAANQLIELAQGDLAGKNIVVNFSYSTGTSLYSSPAYQELFQDLFDALQTQGRIFFVSASGNSGDDLERYYAYPAKVQHAVHCSTAAHDEAFDLGYFSNYGATTVDVAAPGVSMYTTDLDGGYTTENGTSFSAPFVSAVAAYVWADDPTLGAAALKTRLGELATGTPSLEVIAGSPMDPDSAVSFSGAGDVPEGFVASGDAWHLDEVADLRSHPESFDFSDVVCVVWDTGVDSDHPDLTNHLSMDLAYDATGTLQDEGDDPVVEDPEDPEDPDDDEEPLTAGGGGCGIGRTLFPFAAILLLPYFLLSRR